MACNGVDAVKVKFYDCKHGRFAHFENDNCIGAALDLYGEWGEEEIELLSRYIKRGSCVIDVGANVGTHSVAFARICGSFGTILAIEPQPEIYSLLCYSVVANSLTDVVKPVLAAVANKVDLVTYGGLIGVENLAARSFVGELSGATKDKSAGISIRIPVISLDTLKVDNVSLVKIDVEGMEFEVFKGSTDLIKRCKPVFYFEYNPDTNDTLKLIGDFLADKGYRLFWHISNPYNNANFNSAQVNMFGGATERNIIAVLPEHPVPDLKEITDFSLVEPRPLHSDCISGITVNDYGISK